MSKSSKNRQIAVCILFLAAIFHCSLNADIRQDAQDAEMNARRTGLLKMLAQQAKSRGDYLACAALAREADRIANRTDILKQQVLAEYGQLTPVQQNQFRADKNNVIADATITREDADAIKDCYTRVVTIISVMIIFLVVLFLWLWWKAFGPFMRPKTE